MGWFGGTLLAIAPFAALLIPQGRERDSGTLAVSRDGIVVGREEFSLRDGRAGGRDGFTLTSRSIAGTGGEVALLVTIEFGPDSQPVSGQLTEPVAERRTFISLTRRRVAVRAATPTGESVREFRGGAALWMADTLAVAAFALPPRAPEGTLTVVWPRETRVEPLDLADRGIQTASASSPRPLRHLVIGAGSSERHLWYEESGRLMKFEFPAARLTATRITP